MHWRLGVTALAATAAVCLGGATLTTADGGTYPPTLGGPAISVNKPTPAVGDSLTVTATGLCPGGDVVFELTGTSAPTLLASSALTAASDGSASFVFTVPGPAGVTRTAWAKQSSCSLTLSTSVSVVAAATTTTAAPQPIAPSTSVGATTTTVATTPTSAVKVVAPSSTPTLPINVSAAGLCPSQATTFTLMAGADTLSSQSIVSSADGTAAAVFPPRPAGTYTVKVTQDCGTSQSMPVIVESGALVPSATTVPGATANPSGLPTTGADPMGPLQIAVVTVATGVGLALVTRRRRVTFPTYLRRLRSLG